MLIVCRPLKKQFDGISNYVGLPPAFCTIAIAFSFAIIWNSWNRWEILWFIFRYFSMQFRAHLSWKLNQSMDYYNMVSTIRWGPWRDLLLEFWYFSTKNQSRSPWNIFPTICCMTARSPWTAKHMETHWIVIIGWVISLAFWYKCEVMTLSSNATQKHCIEKLFSNDYTFTYSLQLVFIQRFDGNSGTWHRVSLQQINNCYRKRREKSLFCCLYHHWLLSAGYASIAISFDISLRVCVC